MSILAKVIERKLARNVPDIETRRRVGGRVFEALNLSLGDTTLERELFPDGSRGPVRVSTQENFGLADTRYAAYRVRNDEVLSDSDRSLVKEDVTIGAYRNAILLMKVLFGKPDHAMAEIDFYELGEDIDFEPPQF